MKFQPLKFEPVAPALAVGGAEKGPRQYRLSVIRNRAGREGGARQCSG